MIKQALWSKIIGIVALMLMVVGIGLIMGGGRRLEYGGLWLMGIILAAAGAIMSESPFRKIVLWGAGGTVAAMAPGLIAGILAGLKRRVETPEPHPIIIIISVIIGFLSQIALFGGTVGVLLDARPVSSPSGSGAGEAQAEAAPAELISPHPPAELKRRGRKKGLVWATVAIALLLLVGGAFLVTRSRDKSGGPEKPNAEGQYFAVGSTREDVLRIQGPPTYKLELVWFYEDSQVQFDSDGKVAYIWDISKNLKVKSEKRQ